MSREEYINFMCNMNNYMDCDVCPENRDWSDWGGCKPCGQQVCIVWSHCKDAVEDEEDE